MAGEIVNQPYTTIKWWPQALVVCNCKRDQGEIQIIALTGVQNRVTCPHCQKMYHIRGFVASPEGPAIVVEMETPSKVVM